MNGSGEVAGTEMLWRCVHRTHLTHKSGLLRASSAAFIPSADDLRISVFLAESANLHTIVAYFSDGGVSVAQLCVANVVAAGFSVIRTAAEGIDEPHADIVLPFGMSTNQMNNKGRSLAKVAELIYVNIQAALAILSP